MYLRRSAALALLLLGLSGCAAFGKRSPQWTSGYHTSGLSVRWTPLAFADDRVSFAGAEIQPHGAVRILEVELVFQTKSGDVVGKTVARPVPADARLRLGSATFSTDAGLVGKLTIKHSHSSEPVVIALR